MGAKRVSKRVKVKKRCCKDGPRCKKCPVVLKKLERAGYAERLGPRDYILIDVTAKAMAKARARG